jgi:membrane fusion protein (multidrug efflux system)
MMALRKMRRLFLALLSLGILVVALMWFSGVFRHRVEPGRVEAPTRTWDGEPTGKVHLVTERVVESAVGSIQASQRTAVGSQILAKVEEVRVRAGDVVEQGDLLIVLDSRDLEARVAQAQEAVSAAEADAARAEADLARYVDLRQQNVISQSEYDRVESAALVARATLAQSRRALDEAQVSLTYASIHAPISGRVVERLIEPGDQASPGQALLTLYNPDVLRLEAPVREGLATTIRIGDEMEVRIDTHQREVTGVVQEMVPQAETGSRSFLVKVLLPRSEDLYTGMFGRLLIPAGERQRLCLPLAALEQVGQLEFVEVVRPGGEIERRLVVTGEHSEQGQVEVLSGLASGETVLLRG